ncbi:arylsulfatase [Sandaracinobacteroides hominis]|uniref:arylsulfatase n=1 Tax=Sandaracinobacteroides hominis TaxID=2780086 RepID=UPI0018F464C5|nr:arylsulfatase [Sandaracinobacteroides hominis]
MADEEKRKLDRRSLLVGGAVGVGVAGAAAVGARAIEGRARQLKTPKAVAKGEAAEIAESFADSRPMDVNDKGWRDGAPNVVAILLDDVGFADLGCYGSEIPTPAIDALAAAGLRYSNFRTTAMCSPTRAAFLTGLNHHSAGMGWLADIDSGYPGTRGDLTHDAATVAEILGDAGWSTFLCGKWHVNSGHSTGANGPYRNWPTQRGFDRAYWFQGHSTDYFHPSELFDGVAPVEPPTTPDYYVNDDLTDRAMAYLGTQQALEPGRPFFLQLAFPGVHSPLQVRRAEREKFRGAYDAGWDAVRSARLQKQIELGIMPAGTKLPALSSGAKPWADVPAADRALYARYMEIYAAMLANIDANIGRLLVRLEQLGVRENTLVLLFSDNGGSAEGTETGTPNVFAAAFGRPVPVAEAQKLIDVMGEDPTFPHYPIGWTNASTTPFRLYKQFTHLGGVADPLLVSWPKAMPQKGAVRSQFVHVIDLLPTILEVAEVKPPEARNGRRMKPLEGDSIFGTFADAAAPTRTEQYFELGGNRAYYAAPFRLVTRHERGAPFTEDKWELYDLSKDPNELNDLAASRPDKVAELADKWNAAAERYQVFPLDDRQMVIRLVQDRQNRGIRETWDLRPPIERLSREVAPVVCGLPHEIIVDCVRTGDGVLVAHGSQPAGYTLYIKGGRLYYEQSLLPWREVIDGGLVPMGKLEIRYVQKMESRPFDGSGALFVNGRQTGSRKFRQALFSTGYDGFSVGADLGNRVSPAYAAPFPFAGSIERVRIDVDASALSMVEQARFLKAMALRV